MPIAIAGRPSMKSARPSNAEMCRAIGKARRALVTSLCTVGGAVSSTVAGLSVHSCRAEVRSAVCCWDSRQTTGFNHVARVLAAAEAAGDHISRQARNSPIADDNCTGCVPHHKSMIDDQGLGASPPTVHELVGLCELAEHQAKRLAVLPEPFGGGLRGKRRAVASRTFRRCFGCPARFTRCPPIGWVAWSEEEDDGADHVAGRPGPEHESAEKPCPSAAPGGREGFPTSRCRVVKDENGLHHVGDPVRAAAELP